MDPQDKPLCQGCALPIEITQLHCSQKPIHRWTCPACQQNHPTQCLTVAAMPYGFPGQRLIHAYKERAQLGLARPIGALMVKAFELATQKGLLEHGVSVWIPIPASQRRLQVCGFSPAQQLALQVAQATQARLWLDGLALTRLPALQKSAKRLERHQQVQGLFQAADSVSGQWVGVVDDVMTTGATVDQAARALKTAGAAGVVVLVAARTQAIWHNHIHV